MNINIVFVAVMVLVGGATGALFAMRPQLAVFPYMSYFTVLIAMAVLEFGLMLSGRLKRPVSLEVRLGGLVLGIVTSALTATTLAAK